QVQVVYERQTQTGDPDLVHREGPVRDAEARHRVGDPVAAEQCDLTLVEERQAVGVHPRHARTGVQRAAGRTATGVASGGDHQDVTRPDVHPERALGVLQVRPGDDRATIEMFDTLRG